MAIEIKRQNKTNFGLWLAVLILVCIAGWLGWSFLKPVYVAEEPTFDELFPVAPLVPQQLDIEGVLNNSIFQTLKIHITWPLALPPLGRTNPFKPF